MPPVWRLASLALDSDAQDGGLTSRFAPVRDADPDEVGARTGHMIDRGEAVTTVANTGEARRH
ncbi:hypothetical protein CD790_29325 [Streptomyces sp. SAJ15]|nr:hypothetical protein CD790_29325 [Streptomyces sp. SAJ15]